MPQRPPYPTPPRHSRHGSEEDDYYYYGAANDERPRRRRDYDEQQRRSRDDYSSRNYNYDYEYDYYRGGNGDEERYYQSRRSQRDRYAAPPDYYTMQPPPPPPPSSSSHRDAHRDRYNYEERGHYDYYERRGSRDARTTSGPAPVYYQEDYEPTRQAEATGGSHRAPPLSEYYNTPPAQSNVAGPAATMMPYATSGSIFAAPDAMAGQPAPVLQQQQPEVCGSGMSTNEGQDIRVVVGRVAPTSTTITTTQVNAPTVSQQPAVMSQPVGNTISSEKSARPTRRPAETSVLRPGATHLVVPTTLPIQVSSLLDLLAFYVVQGGPTTEEEIYRREEHNPHFAFLNAKWNDPRLIYYRWRLYSLLQGDTMTSWRTAPFQIEAGAKAHIWQPPPLPQAGPDALLQAFTVPLPESTTQHKRARDDAEKKTEEETKEKKAHYPPPSALWLGHQVVGEGKMFVTLSEEDVAEWTTLLDVEATLQEAVTTNSEEEEIKTTTSAQTDYAVLLSREVIARRMVFAIEHSSAAVHVLSLVLDAVLRVTYDCARQLQAKQQHPNVSQTLSEEVIAQLERACYALLGYLFLLHDIARNAPFKPVVCTEAELEQMYTEYQLTGTVPEELTGKAHSHLLSRSAPALHAAMEMIMPTLLEACTLTAMTVLHMTHHLQRQPNSKEEAEGEEEEFVVSCRISHDATRISSEVVQKDQRVTTKAFLLLHWMKELFVLWSPASVQDTLGGESHASNDAEGVTASLVRGEASVEDLLKSKLSPQEILRAAAAAELADRQKKISSSGGSTSASDIRPAALLQLSKRGEQRRRRRVRTAVLSGRVSTILAERYGFLLAGDEATEAS